MPRASRVTRVCGTHDPSAQTTPPQQARVIRRQVTSDASQRLSQHLRTTNEPTIRTRHGEREVTSGTICIGGIGQAIAARYHLIRFVKAQDIPKCERDTVLVGSIRRNRRFEDERSDPKELSVDIAIRNRTTRGTVFLEDAKKYLGISTNVPIEIAPRARVTLSGWAIADGNPLSMSLSMIKKGATRLKKKELFCGIRKNLGLENTTPALCFRCPERTIRLITERLSCHPDVKCQLLAMSGPIDYQDRTITVESFEEHKDTIDQLFHSNTLHLSLLFRKPKMPYENDREFRIVWLAYDGADSPESGTVRTNYQEQEHIILEDINFSEHFTIVREGDELQ